MPNTPASQSSATFRQAVSVSIEIDAPPSRVWALLVDPAAHRAWNSTLSRIDGEIREGGKVELEAVASPGRSFKLAVGGVVENQAMTWSDGFAPMFKGVRTFRLDDLGSGRCSFTMEEVLSGMMLPMIKGSLPDFLPVFDSYARDLKRAAEASPR